MMNGKIYTAKYFRKNKLKLLIGLILFIASSLCCAQVQQATGDLGLSKINDIHIQVHENGFVGIEEDFELNNTIGRMKLPLSVENILVKDSRGNTLEYDLNPLEDGQIITIYLKSPEQRGVTLNYETFDLTGKAASTWTFGFSTLATPGNTIVQIDFPSSAEVIDLRPKNLLRSPKNLTTSMMLYPQETEFGFEYDYHLTQVSADPGFNPGYLPLIGIPVILVLIFLILRRSKRSPSPEPETSGNDPGLDVSSLPDEVIVDECPSISVGSGNSHESSMEVSPIAGVVMLGPEDTSLKVNDSVLAVLEENERKVVELMLHAEQEITQAYIYKTTGIPKATLSDLIKRLERRNIIEKRRNGRTNWIKLQKWVFEE